jgi:hypothetical protein
VPCSFREKTKVWFFNQLDLFERKVTMPEPNSKNTGKGKSFQTIAEEVLGHYFQVGFQIEHPIPIGNPPKNHKFDLVSENGKYIGECKNYSWTEGGNVPSAKIGFINEDVFYLQHIPSDKYRFVVLRRDVDYKHTETLADYYYRTNRHLLNGVHVIEIDVLAKSVRILGD